MTLKMLLTSSPVEGGKVDPGQPVDDLRQHEDDDDAQDGDRDQAGKLSADVRVKAKAYPPFYFRPLQTHQRLIITSLY